MVLSKYAMQLVVQYILNCHINYALHFHLNVLNNIQTDIHLYLLIGTVPIIM